MSIKIIHLIFITLSIILCLGFGVWSIGFACKEISRGYCTAGGFGIGIAVCLCVYGWYFIKKVKTL